MSTGSGRTQLPKLWQAAIDDFPTAVAWSPDGERCAIGSARGDLFVFDGASGERLWRVRAHGGGVLALDWSRRPATQSPLLATAGQDGTVQLHDVDARVTRAKLPCGSAWVEHVAWSPDATRLAAAAGKKVRVFDADGALVVETEPQASTITGLQWNRAGTWIATSCYGGVSLFGARSPAPLRQLPWKGSLISLGVSPDDQVIACASQDCSVHFWRVATGGDAAMSGYRFKPKALAWSADSTLLATSGEADITVWDFAGNGPEGTEPLVLRGHLALLTALTFSRAGTLLASGAQDCGVLVWRPRHQQQPVAWAFLGDYVAGLAISDDGSRLAGVDNAGGIAVWRMQ